MALPFGSVPSGARKSLAPFKVSIADEQIEELKTLVSLSKIGPQTYEGLQQDRKYGITTEWLSSAKEQWKGYDWYLLCYRGSQQ
jgi:microsomal epoxide hydrolase